MAVTVATGYTTWDMITLDATAGEVVRLDIAHPCDLIIDPRGADCWVYLAGTDGGAASGDYDIVYAGSKERFRLVGIASIYVACPTVNSQVICVRTEPVSG